MFGGFLKAVLYSVFTLVFSVAIFAFFTSGVEPSMFGAAVVLVLFVSVMLSVFLRDVGREPKGDGWHAGHGTPGDSGGD